MKPLRFLLLAVVLCLAGGVAYLSFADVPVPQETVSVTIPNDRFFNAP